MPTATLARKRRNRRPNPDAVSYTHLDVYKRQAPAIARLVNAIAARFGVVVSEEVAAKAIPIIGAVGGGMVNVMFIGHYQELARGHFIVKRLEAARGPEQVRRAYDLSLIHI